METRLNDFIYFDVARTPPGPDNFKRVLTQQTFQTSFPGGFESVANIVFSFETYYSAFAEK